MDTEESEDVEELKPEGSGKGPSENKGRAPRASLRPERKARGERLPGSKQSTSSKNHVARRGRSEAQDAAAIGDAGPLECPPYSLTGPKREGGFTTAELLANAALAIIALVAIWAALQKMGIHVVDWIQQQLGM